MNKRSRWFADRLADWLGGARALQARASAGRRQGSPRPAAASRRGGSSSLHPPSLPPKGPRTGAACSALPRPRSAAMPLKPLKIGWLPPPSPGSTSTYGAYINNTQLYCVRIQALSPKQGLVVFCYNLKFGPVRSRRSAPIYSCIRL